MTRMLHEQMMAIKSGLKEEFLMMQTQLSSLMEAHRADTDEMIKFVTQKCLEDFPIKFQAVDQQLAATHIGIQQMQIDLTHFR